MASAPAQPDDVLERLRTALPEPRCELVHADAWQLLVATILSAQSTDKGVNLVTPDLFDRWPTPADLAAAPEEDVQRVVHSTGFFRRKTQSIQGAARQIRDEFDGQVPRTMDELLTLPGVARKTANLVLGTAYRIATGIIVDTHARRVSQRLGLTTAQKPDTIEADLCAAFDQSHWIDMGHRLVLHGRYVCTAKKPDCAQCPLNDICPSREAAADNGWTALAARERERIESHLPV